MSQGQASHTLPTTGGGYCSIHGAYIGFSCPSCVVVTPNATPGVMGGTWTPLAAPRRARLVLEFTENGEREHSAEDGWAKIDGDWVLWFPDDGDCWTSWPSRNVVCVEWRS